MDIKIHIPDDNELSGRFIYIDDAGNSIDYCNIGLIEKIKTIYALCAMLKFLSK